MALHSPACAWLWRGILVIALNHTTPLNLTTYIGVVFIYYFSPDRIFGWLHKVPVGHIALTIPIISSRDHGPVSFEPNGEERIRSFMGDYKGRVKKQRGRSQ